MTNTILFPGSFDPFTRGHADLVARALRQFDRIIIGIGYNEQKCGMIPVEERVSALRALYANETRISVQAYTGLTTDFAVQCGATAILRGVRSTKDYEYELSMADVNRRLAPQLETIVLLAHPELACCSSSVVRELLHFGHDISQWLPQGLHYPTLKQQ